MSRGNRKTREKSYVSWDLGIGNDSGIESEMRDFAFFIAGKNVKN